MNQFIPKIKFKNRCSPPWMDEEIVHLSKRKETARKKALRTNTPESWNKYIKLRNSFKHLLEM